MKSYIPKPVNSTSWKLWNSCKSCKHYIISSWIPPTILFIISCYQIPYKFKVQSHAILSKSQLAMFPQAPPYPILHRRGRRLGQTTEGSTKVTQCMDFKSTLFSCTKQPSGKACVPCQEAGSIIMHATIMWLDRHKLLAHTCWNTIDKLTSAESGIHGQAATHRMVLWGFVYAVRDKCFITVIFSHSDLYRKVRNQMQALELWNTSTLPKRRQGWVNSLMTYWLGNKAHEGSLLHHVV